MNQSDYLTQQATREYALRYSDLITHAVTFQSFLRPFNASVAALGQYALVCERIRLEKPAVANFLDWFADQLAD